MSCHPVRRYPYEINLGGVHLLLLQSSGSRVHHNLKFGIYRPLDTRGLVCCVCLRLVGEASSMNSYTQKRGRKRPKT